MSSDFVALGQVSPAERAEGQYEVIVKEISKTRVEADEVIYHRSKTVARNAKLQL